MKESSTKWQDLGLLFLRVMMGAGIAYHGYGKVFGGHIDQLIGGVAKMGLPFPQFFGWAAALSEFLGGICIAIGLFTRPAAFFVFITMSVAAFMVHKADPLQVKEIALAYWSIAGALVLMGSGSFSIANLVKK